MASYGSNVIDFFLGGRRGKPIFFIIYGLIGFLFKLFCYKYAFILIEVNAIEFDDKVIKGEGNYERSKFYFVKIHYQHLW